MSRALAIVLLVCSALVASASSAQPLVILPDPEPAPALVEQDDSEWYGYWQLVGGPALAGLYTAAVYATHRASGSEKVGGAFGSAYLFSGYMVVSGSVHAQYDNERSMLISLGLRLLGGIAVPVTASVLCGNAPNCSEVVAAATAAGTLTPVAIDTAFLSWD